MKFYVIIDDCCVPPKVLGITNDFEAAHKFVNNYYYKYNISLTITECHEIKGIEKG